MVRERRDVEIELERAHNKKSDFVIGGWNIVERHSGSGRENQALGASGFQISRNA